MARKVETIVTLTDDLDGGKADQTIAFTIDGTTYELDVSRKNRTAFDKAMKPFVDSARKVRGTRSTTSTKTKSRSDLNEIREWAQANGHAVSDRGRIAGAVIAAYDTLH